jgi:hypothetical protein
MIGKLMTQRGRPFTDHFVRLLAIALLTMVGGCGYSHTGDAPSDGYRWRSLYREDVRTIAVPIFTNKDFTRGVEFALSKSLVNQIEAHTPYKVVPRERADSILEGQITAIRRSTVSRDTETAVPQEQLYEIYVDFVWKDLHTGRIIVQRENFAQTRTYYTTLGEGRFVGQQQAVENLALAIVQELQADW